MRLEGILFDLDGTLANTLPVCILTFQSTIEHFTGEKTSESRITDLFGINEEGMLKDLIPSHPVTETLPYFVSEYERLHSRCEEPFSGIERIFPLLAAKSIRTAIVTGKGALSAAVSVRILGLNRWIDMMEVGFPDRTDKPGSINKILQQWNMPAGHAAYVGDTLYDMRASQEAGLLPLGAAWGETSELRNGSKSAAKRIFHTIESFIAWIDQLDGPQK